MKTAAELREVYENEVVLDNVTLDKYIEDFLKLLEDNIRVGYTSHTLYLSNEHKVKQEKYIIEKLRSLGYKVVHTGFKQYNVSIFDDDEKPTK